MKVNLFVILHNRFLFFLAASLIVLQSIAAQQVGPSEFLNRVFIHHPDAKRAELLTEISAAALLSARGGFDPELFSDFNSKTFKGDDYWNISESGVWIPTMGGLEIMAGYRTATGDFLNEERSIPAAGQAFAGIKANLLQGLITDERRTGLQRARLLNDWNQLEANAIRNDIGYYALLAYLELSYLTTEMDILENSIVLNETQLEQSIISFETGASASLDTLEIAMQVQQRKLDLASVVANIAAVQAEINVYTNDGPALAPQQTITLDAFMDLLRVYGSLPDFANNPELRAYDFKLADLQLERRLKAQKRLPKLSVKYEAMADAFDFTPTDGEGSSVGSFILNDNKFDVAFSVPIPNRSARGELKLAELKIQDTDLQRTLKSQELEQKTNQYLQQIQIQQRQLDQQTSLVAGYLRLLEAERLKFRLGDSSAFFVNTRENKYLEGRVKMLKTQKDLIKTYLSLHYTTGNFPNW